MEHALHLALYGENYSVFVERDLNYELTRYRRLRDPGSGYQGPSRPRPVLTAYRGYEGPQAEQTWFYDNGTWRNCFDEMEVWNG